METHFREVLHICRNKKNNLVFMTKPLPIALRDFIRPFLTLTLIKSYDIRSDFMNINEHWIKSYEIRSQFCCSSQTYINTCPLNIKFYIHCGYYDTKPSLMMFY